MQVRNMTALECTNLLDRVRIGRLACSQGNEPYVVPFHFAHADNRLYAFSLPGKKIDVMRSNPKVCVLVEEPSEKGEWKSVVVDGRFEEYPDRIGSKQARERAWSLLSKHAAWWAPGALKPVNANEVVKTEPIFFGIFVERLSGREARNI